jgi:hypothetical protein
VTRLLGLPIAEPGPYLSGTACWRNRKPRAGDHRPAPRSGTGQTAKRMHDKVGHFLTVAVLKNPPEPSWPPPQADLHTRLAPDPSIRYEMSFGSFLGFLTEPGASATGHAFSTEEPGAPRSRLGFC